MNATGPGVETNQSIPLEPWFVMEVCFASIQLDPFETSPAG
jgi:hypothetical protein